MYSANTKERIYGNSARIEIFDIDGWTLKFLEWEDKGTSMWVSRHSFCGSVADYGTDHEDMRYYCKKCRIWMPHETQKVISTLLSGWKKQCPIV